MNQLTISKLLRQLGIPVSLKGYRYLREAIDLVADNPGLSTVKGIYTTIATRNNDKASRVERAMRHAIETSWYRANSDLKLQLFPESKDNPPVREYIDTLADSILVGMVGGDDVAISNSPFVRVHSSELFKLLAGNKASSQ